MTVKEYKKLAAERSSKYRAKKTVLDGMTFDSKKEAGRWCELKLLQSVGEITDLSRQVRFTVIPEQREHGDQGRLLEKRTEYIADFVYRENGELVVEDVKGCRKGAAYELFVIKRKLMLKEYGIRVREV